MLIAALKFPHVIAGFKGFHFHFAHGGGQLPRKGNRCKGFPVQIGQLLQFCGRKNSHDAKRHAPEGDHFALRVPGVDSQVLRHAPGQNDHPSFAFFQPPAADQDFVQAGNPALLVRKPHQALGFKTTAGIAHRNSGPPGAVFIFQPNPRNSRSFIGKGVGDYPQGFRRQAPPVDVFQKEPLVRGRAVIQEAGVVAHGLGRGEAHNGKSQNDQSGTGQGRSQAAAP